MFLYSICHFDQNKFFKSWVFRFGATILNGFGSGKIIWIRLLSLSLQNTLSVYLSSVTECPISWTTCLDSRSSSSSWTQKSKSIPLILRFNPSHEMPRVSSTLHTNLSANEANTKLSVPKFYFNTKTFGILILGPFMSICKLRIAGPFLYRYGMVGTGTRIRHVTGYDSLKGVYRIFYVTKFISSRLLLRKSYFCHLIKPNF